MSTHNKNPLEAAEELYRQNQIHSSACNLNNKINLINDYIHGCNCTRRPTKKEKLCLDCSKKDQRTQSKVLMKNAMLIKKKEDFIFSIFLFLILCLLVFLFYVNITNIVYATIFGIHFLICSFILYHSFPSKGRIRVLASYEYKKLFLPEKSLFEIIFRSSNNNTKFHECIFCGSKASIKYKDEEDYDSGYSVNAYCQRCGELLYMIEQNNCRRCKGSGRMSVYKSGLSGDGSSCEERCSECNGSGIARRCY